MTNSKEVFKEEVKLNIYSLIRLYTNYQIPCLAENIVYSKSLSNILEKYGKKALIYTDQQNMSLVNTFTLENNKEVYLHLLLSQQTVNEYDKLISKRTII